APLWHFRTASVEDEFGTLLDCGLDPVEHELLMTMVHHRAHAGVLVAGRTEIDLFRETHHGFDHLVGNRVFDHYDWQRHAAFARASAERVDDSLGGALDHRVAHHQRVVLGLGKGLHAFAVAGGGCIDVQTHAGRTDEAHALDVGMLEQNLGFIAAGGNDVENAVGQPRLLPQLRDAHGGLRNRTRRLQHHAVSGGNADGNHPALRDHG